LNTFTETLNAAISDMLAHGFDSDERLKRWLAALEISAKASLMPEARLQASVAAMLQRVYGRELKGLTQNHQLLGQFTLAQIRPKLRDELDRRIIASAGLIRLNREASIRRTLQRFAGWASSVPKGGSDIESRRQVKKVVRRGIAALPFEERRVVIDQGHKLAAAISEIVAKDGGAIAAVWEHVKRGPPSYQSREQHVARDGHVFLVRNSWAHKEGLVKLGGHQFTDEIEAPGELVFCSCLTGSTRIPFANIQAVFRRWYRGPLLEIKTASGKSLRLTPNHPVLTAQGWRAADVLNIGDNLVQRIDEIVESMGEKNEDETIPTISEIFDFLAPTWRKRTTRGASHQFHGDGIPDEHVDIVSADGPLRINGKSGIPEGLNQFALAKTNRGRPPKCTFFHYGRRLLFSSIRAANFCATNLFRFSGLSIESYSLRLRQIAQGYSSLFESIVDRHRGNFVKFPEKLSRCASSICANDFLHRELDFFANINGRFGSASDSYSCVSESAPNGGTVNPKTAADFVSVTSSKICLDQTIDIKSSFFSGHVYNLETEDGWYSAEGIITHNCKYKWIYALGDLPSEMRTRKGNEALLEARSKLRRAANA